MKILFVLALEINPKSGGIERVTHVLNEYFSEHGMQVSFLYFRLEKIVYPEFNKTTEVFFLPNTGKPDAAENIISLHKLVREKQFDIIINQGNMSDNVAGLIANSVKGTNCKIITVLHNTPFTFKQFYGEYRQTLTRYLSREKKTFKNLIKRRILVVKGFEQYINSYKNQLKQALDSSTRFVLLSQGYISVLCNVLGVEKQEKIVAIPNPLPFIDNFTPDELEKKKKQIIFVGRLDYNQKRIDRLLSVWSLIESEFPDWKLTIIGGSLTAGENSHDDYQYKELLRLKKFAQSLNLKQVHFTGNQDPVPYYKESSIFCLSSNYEGLPMVLIEAIQYGVVPVVFGSFAAVYDIINHDSNGLIAKPFNIEEFAMMLKQVMVNESARKEMAIKAIEVSKTYAVDEIGKQWIEVFEKVVKDENLVLRTS